MTYRIAYIQTAPMRPFGPKPPDAVYTFQSGIATYDEAADIRDRESAKYGSLLFIVEEEPANPRRQP